MTTAGYVRITYTCGHAVEMRDGDRYTRHEQRAARRQQCDGCKALGLCVRCQAIHQVTVGHLPNGKPGGPFCSGCWSAVRAEAVPA